MRITINDVKDMLALAFGEYFILESVIVRGEKISLVGMPVEFEVMLY